MALSVRRSGGQPCDEALLHGRDDSSTFDTAVKGPDFRTERTLVAVWATDVEFLGAENRAGRSCLVRPFSDRHGVDRDAGDAWRHRLVLLIEMLRPGPRMTPKRREPHSSADDGEPTDSASVL